MDAAAADRLTRDAQALGLAVSYFTSTRWLAVRGDALAG
jgi:hypothetical protein